MVSFPWGSWWFDIWPGLAVWANVLDSSHHRVARLLNSVNFDLTIF